MRLNTIKPGEGCDHERARAIGRAGLCLQVRARLAHPAIVRSDPDSVAGGPPGHGREARGERSPVVRYGATEGPRTCSPGPGW